MAGFNLPPGCSVRDIPGNGPDQPCDVCGGWPEDSAPACICPECPECGDYGNPQCYISHGLRKSLEQELQFDERVKFWAMEAEASVVTEHEMEYAGGEFIRQNANNTPPEIKAAVADAEKCLHIISRAFAAGIPPKYAAARLNELAQVIAEITEQWTPPTSAS